jgi:hypothetical protein
MMALSLLYFMLYFAMLVLAAHAWGWNGGDEGQGCCGDNYHHWGIGNFLQTLQGYQQQGPRPYDNGYNAGIADAVYDHQNNLVYNPQGQCLTCHSELYWHGFREGYDKQWNSYNYQANTQGTSINIYGNNNYVSTNQDSTQASGSSLLRTIGQMS